MITIETTDATIFTGALIGDEHTLRDWGAVITNSDVIAMPEPNTVLLEVPGRSGRLDLSEVLTGDISYGNREIKLELAAQMNRERWVETCLHIFNKYHGRVVQITFDEDPGHYYVGRASILEPQRLSTAGQLTLTIDAEPFRYEQDLYKVTFTGDMTAVSGTIENLRMGDAILQKTFTTDFLTKKRAKNEGQVEQYYVKNSHKAIIPKAEWEAVQMELERRRDYCKEIGIKRYGFATLENPFISKLVCGHCGAIVNKKSWSNRCQHVWACKNKEQKYGGTCHSENVKEEIVRRVVVIAWNAVVKERDKLLETWETMQKSGDPLQVLRAKQMIELTAHGPIKWEIPELTRMVMERIVIHDKRHFTVRFLDGTVKEIVVAE